jgi:hypothetical protein
VPAVSFSDLSKEDADAYLVAVLAGAPARLGNLSGWIRSTGGPWDECDASLVSLGPLWRWFLQFAADGCPGIPVGAVVQNWIRDDEEDVPPLLRVGYAVEAISDYLMLVCRRLDPGAAWSVDRQRRSSTFQETGIKLSNGVWFSPVNALGRMASRAISSGAPASAGVDERQDLVGLISSWVGDLAPAGEQERQGPVLPPPCPTPDPPPVRWRPKSQASEAAVPVMVWPRTADDEVFAAVLAYSDDLIILRGPVFGVPDVGRLEPLDAGLIANHLREHGFTYINDGGDAESWHLDTDDAYASATITFAGGAARMVKGEISEPLDSGAPGFRAAATAFITLAQRLGARLTNSDEIDEELDHDDVE